MPMRGDIPGDILLNVALVNCEVERFSALRWQFLAAVVQFNARSAQNHIAFASKNSNVVAIVIVYSAFMEAASLFFRYTVTEDKK